MTQIEIGKIYKRKIQGRIFHAMPITTFFDENMNYEYIKLWFIELGKEEWIDKWIFQMYWKKHDTD